MRKLILCIAMSLDGYIADEYGSVDFLFERPRVEPDLDYADFYKNIDTIIFGNVTYEQIINEVSPDKWLYPDKKCYVYSNRNKGITESIEYINIPPRNFVEDLRTKEGGNIWLFGGQKIIHSFIEEDLVDEFQIYVIPIILGKGVPLFSGGFPRKDLRLDSISQTNGTAKIFYSRY